MARQKTLKGAGFRNVQTVKRAGGKVDYYHRKARIRLPDNPASPEFAEAWAAAERSIRKANPRGHAPGTFGELVDAFEASEDWRALAERTRADYAKVRDWLYERGGARAFTRELDQARAEKILERALDETNYRFGVYVLQYSRRVWNWSQEKAARKKRWGEGNPWRDIPTPKRPKSLARRDANRPWKPEELAIALERAPVGLCRAYVLGACGYDGGTMIKLQWPDYDAESGVFAERSREKTGVAGFTIIYGPLRPFLENGNRPSPFIVTNALGEPFAKANTLQTRSSEFLRGLASDGLVGEGLTLHGLRHTLGKAMADSGADLRAIQNALRHSTERMALFYSKHADGRRAAEAAAGAVSDWFSVKKDREE